MPAGMEKRKVNTTVFNKELFWRVEWVFPAEGIRLIDAKLAESVAPLAALAQQFSDVEVRTRLTQYSRLPESSWTLCMKAEKRPVRAVSTLKLSFELTRVV